MRSYFHLAILFTICSTGPVRSDDTVPATPTDFAYTEIYTALSEDGTPLHSDVKRITVSGPHQRTDRFSSRSEIVDALTSRMVSIDSQNKTYTIHERQRVINTADGSQTEFEIPARPAHDYYKQLTWMPEGSKRVDLPKAKETTINGHRVHGVRVTHSTTDGTTETTCWTATDTGRVVQVKSTLTPAGDASPQVVILRTAFDYKPIADKSIFSVIPPSGFELKTQPVLGFTSQRD